MSFKIEYYRKLKIITFAFWILLESCSSRVATTSINKAEHNGAILVQPYFRVVKRKPKILNIIYSSALIGMGGYLATSKVTPSGKVATSNDRATGIYVGLAGSGLLTYSLLRKNVFTEKVNSGNFTQWLAEYNKKKRTNYVPVGIENVYNSIYLVPPQNVTSFIDQQQKINEDLAKNAELRRQRAQEAGAALLLGILIIIAAGSESSSNSSNYERSSERASRLNCSAVYTYIDEAYSYSSKVVNATTLSSAQINASQAKSYFESARRAAQNCQCNSASRQADDGYSYASKAYNSTSLSDAQSSARQAQTAADNTKSAAKSCENN